MNLSRSSSLRPHTHSDSRLKIENLVFMLTHRIHSVMANNIPVNVGFYSHLSSWNGDDIPIQMPTIPDVRSRYYVTVVVIYIDRA